VFYSAATGGERGLFRREAQSVLLLSLNFRLQWKGLVQEVVL
jgi:hypothetical protein